MFLCYHMRESYGFYAALVFFLALWSSDIGAYFMGKLLKGPKMAVDISPNKTWAGYIGAVIAPALILSLFTLQLTPLTLLGGLALGITGQAGDLLESKLKRKCHVKDAGDMIPGHGGILDRIDSLIPAVPVYLALIKLGLLL